MGSRLEAGTTTAAAGAGSTARGLCAGEPRLPGARSGDGAGRLQRRLPDPAAPKAAPATPTLATPTITPGHDAAAVAAKDMPFTAGETLAAGVPVQLSDGLRDVPGWKPGKENLAGASEYVKEDGCVVSAKVRTNQSALAVPGDDRASTEALFQYLDASILPGLPETGDPALGRGTRRTLPGRRGAGVQGRRTVRHQGHRDLRPAVQQVRFLGVSLRFLPRRRGPCRGTVRGRGTDRRRSSVRLSPPSCRNPSSPEPFTPVWSARADSGPAPRPAGRSRAGPRRRSCPG